MGHYRRVYVAVIFWAYAGGRGGAHELQEGCKQMELGSDFYSHLSCFSSIGPCLHFMNQKAIQVVSRLRAARLFGVSRGSGCLLLPMDLAGMG